MSGMPLVVEGRKEYKDEQLLARLIGAAVLLAIAVIVLPFVLDGAGSQHEYDYAESLPVEPERPVPERSFSSRQPLPAPASTGDIEEVAVAVPATTEASFQSGAPTASVETDPEPARSAASAGSVSRATEVTLATNTDAESTQIPVGWNIQVASFIKSENARKLLNRLDKESLSAFVNRIDGRQRPIYRVFVGPLANQIDALDLKNRIDRTYRVESIMVKRN